MSNYRPRHEQQALQLHLNLNLNLQASSGIRPGREETTLSNASSEIATLPVVVG